MEKVNVIGLNIFNEDESILIPKRIPLKKNDLSLFKKQGLMELKEIINGRFNSDDDGNTLCLYFEEHDKYKNISTVDPSDIHVFSEKDMEQIKKFIKKSQSEIIRKRKMDAMGVIVAQTIMSYFNTDDDDFFGRNRSRNISQQRQMAMKIMYESRLEPTTSWIGAFLKRNHATVIHGIRTITNLMSYDNKISGDYGRVLSVINMKLEAAGLVKKYYMDTISVNL